MSLIFFTFLISKPVLGSKLAHVTINTDHRLSPNGEKQRKYEIDENSNGPTML